jgi:hypothetical protein
VRGQKPSLLSLGQVKVDEKSNEITAIPQLLDVLAIKVALNSENARSTMIFHL